MRTETVQLFKLDELPEDVQNRIVERWRETHNDFPWWAEWNQSREAFMKAIGIKESLRAGWTDPWDRDDTPWGELGPDDVHAFDLSGSCPLTGYTGDEALLDGIRNAKPTDTFRAVMDDCFHRWAREKEADMDDYNSSDYVRDEILTNGYEFTEGGVLW